MTKGQSPMSSTPSAARYAPTKRDLPHNDRSVAWNRASWAHIRASHPRRHGNSHARSSIRCSAAAYITRSLFSKISCMLTIT